MAYQAIKTMVSVLLHMETPTPVVLVTTNIFVLPYLSKGIHPQSILNLVQRERGFLPFIQGQLTTAFAALQTW